jgi:hypothetical protein
MRDQFQSTRTDCIDGLKRMQELCIDPARRGILN